LLKSTERLTTSSIGGQLPVATGNFPISLDEGHHRLFVGTRSPPELIVLDATTGSMITRLAIPQDSDDIFYNPPSGCIYVSVERIRERRQLVDPNHYSVVENVATSPNARTTFMATRSNLLFVAALGAESNNGKILVYDILS
jgi:hypothetical protein